MRTKTRRPTKVRILRCKECDALVIDAFDESILKSVPTHIKVQFGHVWAGVTDDYGRVSWRAVSRRLKLLVEEGHLLRTGGLRHYWYQRPRV